MQPMSPTLNLPIEWLPAQGRPEQLIVLLHGWAHDATDFLPVAQALRDAFAQAAILAPESPLAADGGRPGRQWYSIQGIEDPVEWRRRVDDSVERIAAWVRAQQARLGVGEAATALGGFSQGGVLALHTATRYDGIAGRVLAFGARMVELPEVAPRHATLHLFHGSADKIFPVDQARALLERIGELQGDATLDVAEGLGHALHPALTDCMLHRLRNHIPLRTWREAMGAASAARPGAAGAPTDDD
jgi:phospholipase/carboxylesterase